MSRLELPQVTLCAAASVNVRATIVAVQRCLDQANFADCVLFTDESIPEIDTRIRCIPIARLSSGLAYSQFILSRLVEFVASPYCLIVQWDGFIIDASQWDPAFLQYDYIGAPWPQFSDGRDVGNGGFSLRSRRLLEACRDPRFQVTHPEDLAVCRINRQLLECEHRIRFADHRTAARFSHERGKTTEETFGFHGIFNMIPLLGADRFWNLYRLLDNKSTAFVDYQLLMRQLGSAPGAIRRRARLTGDRILAFCRV